VSYATSATERAARAEAEASRAQLSALRSQLNPHFLFNALHTIVQLIPREPARAAQAAEQLGGLLRDTLEEDRDVVALAEERAFVERYLAVQRLRFGDRLSVRIDVSPEADQSLVPSFALLTAAEQLGMPLKALKREVEDGSIVAVSTASGSASPAKR
jgi:LytS/YehU family sensor histidine kinase